MGGRSFEFEMLPFPSALVVVVDAGDVGVEVEVYIIIIMEVIDMNNVNR